MRTSNLLSAMPLVLLALSACDSTLPPAPMPEHLICEETIDADVVSDTVWGENCVTVRVMRDVRVTANLTISSGTKVKFEQDVHLEIAPAGSIRASSVDFAGREFQKGYWGGIAIRSRSPLNRFERVTISDTGAPGHQFTQQALFIGGDSDKPGYLETQQLDIVHGTGDGLVIGDGGDVIGGGHHYEELDGFPIVLPTSRLQQIDANTTFADDLGKPWILVTRSTIEQSAHWLAHAIPYRFTDVTHVIDSDDAVITIEAGARFEMEQDVEFQIKRGALTAIGTAQDRILFQGVDKVPGYWAGLTFLSNREQNQLEHTDVGFAGSPGFLFREQCIGLPPEGRLTIANSSVHHCSGAAIRLHEDATLSTQNILFFENDEETAEW